MTVFFLLDKKKLKFKFRSQNAPLRSLFSAFGINIVFFMLKKDNHYENESTSLTCVSVHNPRECVLFLALSSVYVHATVTVLSDIPNAISLAKMIFITHHLKQ
jgi:hypothetical protein